MPKIRSRYDGSRVDVDISDFGPSLTKQSFKEAADVNSVLERYSKTGVWSRMERAPLFGDVSMIEDFHSALNKVMDARNDVRRLPDAARQAYQDDPGAFLGRVLAGDRDDLVSLGLLEPVVEPEAIVEPASPAPAAASAAGAQ